MASFNTENCPLPPSYKSVSIGPSIDSVIETRHWEPWALAEVKTWKKRNINTQREKTLRRATIQTGNNSSIINWESQEWNEGINTTLYRKISWHELTDWIWSITGNMEVVICIPKPASSPHPQNHHPSLISSSEPASRPLSLCSLLPVTFVPLSSPTAAAVWAFVSYTCFWMVGFYPMSVELSFSSPDSSSIKSLFKPHISYKAFSLVGCDLHVFRCLAASLPLLFLEM